METYQDFFARIGSFETSELNISEKEFAGNASIAQKVKPDNSFGDFFGDTIVFNLDEETKVRLRKWENKLYEVVPQCFCERLHSDTFHMTLHDLSNSKQLTEVAADVFVNELKLREKCKEIKEFNSIKMRSKCLFNMVDTSLVLGLYPVVEEEYEKLMDLYQVFESVKQLDYPLTPHITLAYYNVNGFDAQSAEKLKQLIYELNTCELLQPLEVELDSTKLYYQKFFSMNDYIDVFGICGR